MAKRKEAEEQQEDVAIVKVEEKELTFDELKAKEDAAAKAETWEALMNMDISKLPREDRPKYLNALARSQGLNPLMKPFDVIEVANDKGGTKLIVYANRGCADQIADLRKLTTEVRYRGLMPIGPEKYLEGQYAVIVRVTDPDGVRFTDNIGISDISNASGKGLATLIMKTETKAIRRARLSHAGVGFPDVEELDYVPEVRLPGPRVIEPPAPRALPVPPMTVVDQPQIEEPAKGVAHSVTRPVGPPQINPTKPPVPNVPKPPVAMKPPIPPPVKPPTRA